MLPEQWEIFKRGYLGIKHLDYYLHPEVWFEEFNNYPTTSRTPAWQIA
jgi:hypothetical protein